MSEAPTVNYSHSRLSMCKVLSRSLTISFPDGEHSFRLEMPYLGNDKLATQDIHSLHDTHTSDSKMI